MKRIYKHVRITFLVSLSVICFGCSTKEAIYVIAQAAETGRCERQSNTEDRFACKQGQQSYEEYKKQREVILEEN